LEAVDAPVDEAVSCSQESVSSTEDSADLSLDAPFAFGTERLSQTQMSCNNKNDEAPTRPPVFRFQGDGPPLPSQPKRDSQAVTFQLSTDHSRGRGQSKRRKTEQARDDPCCSCSPGSTCSTRGNCTCTRAGRPCRNCDPGSNCCNTGEHHRLSKLTRAEKRASNNRTVQQFRAHFGLQGASADATSTPSAAHNRRSGGEATQSAEATSTANQPPKTTGETGENASNTPPNNPLGGSDANAISANQNAGGAKTAAGTAAVDPPSAGGGGRGGGRNGRRKSGRGPGKEGSRRKNPPLVLHPVRQAATTQGGPPGSLIGLDQNQLGGGRAPVGNPTVAIEGAQTPRSNGGEGTGQVDPDGEGNDGEDVPYEPTT
jgi:hypothetical protein